MVSGMNWSMSGRGWAKLNIDDVVSLSFCSTAIGGVIRDEEGNWLYGYLMILGRDEVFRIEARSMLEGLCLTSKKGYWHVELEYDNALLVELILSGKIIDSPLIEIWAIRSSLQRNWKVESIIFLEIIIQLWVYKCFLNLLKLCGS
ncbi:hypothetical protein J1N35_011298 [Gossypium stocksii]|uniref:RNase H type-1 domain-containing protein n=1 Tax=Gossypium stocksii TaxID=47602 RepID=A0A9D3W469_9ROSI|nr:hypothetical protein J1N35_011298 [Gossypium stocksii]